MASVSHHDIRNSMLGRIQSGEWALGDLIPAEMALAEEYGCARTTINRALQALADKGLLVRKRKGGTRVCQMPVRQAKFEIPVIREQVEGAGGKYDHRLDIRKLRTPPPAVRKRLNIPDGTKALYLETRHMADDRPFAFEERWINTFAVPKITDAPLDELSANEWLVKTMPFSSGDVIFSAINANEKVASALGVNPETAIFVVDRTTWFRDEFITTMKLYYEQGYQLYSRL